MDELTDLERQVLDLASRWYRHPGAREAAIRDELDLSGARFSQLLRGRLDRPEALAYAPATVRRYRRLLVARRTRREPPAGTPMANHRLWEPGPAGRPSSHIGGHE